jgi:peptidoglycan/xylan/chitin deacetylase (PgdA/CDA1 family)
MPARAGASWLLRVPLLARLSPTNHPEVAMPLTSRGFPLMLTFDLDGETMWTSRDPAAAKRPILLSQGAYGWKTGVPRILDLLRRYDIRSTFFVPGLIVEQRPQAIEAILAAGHEIAHHSYSHAWIVNLTHDQEREEMDKGFEAIRRATGKAPRGYRAPASEFSDITLGLMKSYGFRYSSNFYDADSPYLLEIDGERSDIVELPFRWALVDAPYFQYSIVLPGRTMHAPSSVLETWKTEFDVLHAEERMMTVAMHPQLIGQPSRLTVLQGLIEHALSHSDVWIGRCDEISDALRPGLA